MKLSVVLAFLFSVGYCSGLFFGCCSCPAPFRGSCRSQAQYPQQQQVQFPQVPQQQQQYPRPVVQKQAQQLLPSYIQPPVIGPSAIPVAKGLTHSYPILIENHYITEIIDDPIVEYVVVRQPPAKVQPAYVLPPKKKDDCYTNDSGFKCCNTDLEKTMHGSYTKLKASKNFNDCNIGLMSKVIQKDAQKRFQLSFEVVVSLKPFGSNSAYDGNYTCRFEKDGKHFMSYASPTQYDVGNAKSEDTLSNADATHDSKETEGDGKVTELSEKQEKVDKLNEGLDDVKSTGKELHERRTRAISMKSESFFIHDDEFVAFTKLNSTGRENKFITHEITMGSFNPSLLRQKIKKNNFC